MYEHQDGQAERVNFPLFNLFCSVQTVEGLDEAIHVGEGYLLSSVYLVKCEFHLEPSSQTHSEILFKQISELETNTTLYLFVVVLSLIHEEPNRFLCPWNFPDKNTGVGSHCLFQGISPTLGLKLGLPHCRQIL